MRRAHYRYDLWEDYQAGMYRTHYCGDEIAAQNAAKELLTDQDVFHRVATDMVRAWPIAAEQALTHTASNRQAWIGQAACCFFAAIPDYITKRAWWTLTDAEQTRANRTADDVIRSWEKGYRDAETLFGR